MSNFFFGTEGGQLQQTQQKVVVRYGTVRYGGTVIFTKVSKKVTSPFCKAGPGFRKTAESVKNECGSTALEKEKKLI